MFPGVFFQIIVCMYYRPIRFLSLSIKLKKQKVPLMKNYKHVILNYTIIKNY